MLSCTSMCMRRVATDDVFDNTAQFNDSPHTSPQTTPRSKSCMESSILRQTPRAATSFLYALMHCYDVNERDATIQFPDYMQSTACYQLPLSMTFEWMQVVAAFAHSSLSSLLIAAEESDADQRDLRHALRKIWEFNRGLDLAPETIVLYQINQLLRVNRSIRLQAFADKKMDVILAARYMPVQYAHLDQGMRPPSPRNNNALKNCTIL